MNKAKVYIVLIVLTLLCSLLAIFPSVNANPTHTFDAKNRVTGTANPLLVSHICGSGATLLVLSLVVAAAVARTGGAPSYNGIAMAQVGITRVATETNCEMWYLLNPSIGTFNVSIPNSGVKTLYAVTSSYKAQSGYASALDVSTGSVSTSSNPFSYLITTSNGDVIVQVVGDGRDTAPTANSHVLLYSVDDGLYSDNAQYALQAYLGEITLSWTCASDDWCAVAGAFKEVVIPSPTNDACDSSATFTLNIDGWVNMTVSDPNLVAYLYTVDIQVSTIGDAETFTLRWTQSSNTFSEVSDLSGICTLSASSIRVNIDSDTDKIAFKFKFTGGTVGSCDVKATTTNDGAKTDIDTYNDEFIFGFTPNYSNLTFSDFQAGMSCTFNVTWNAVSGNLDKYKFESNNTGTFTNTTYSFPSGKTTWGGNVTLTLNSTSYVQVNWREWANNTVGRWNTTDWQYITVFPKTPPMQTATLGYSTLGGRNSIYYEALKHVIYVVWLNSSICEYQIAAYDVEDKTWTSSHDIGTAPSVDDHQMPTVGVFPSGQIVIIYGHLSPLHYRYTTANAKTESNLNTLLSSWSTEADISGTTSASYPDTITFDNILILFFRDVDFHEYYVCNFTTSWSAKREIISSTEDLYFGRPIKVNSTAWMVEGVIGNPITGHTEDMLFFYCDDQGWTFHVVNGTELSIPFTHTDIKIFSRVPCGYSSPYIDSDDNVYCPYGDLKTDGKGITGIAAYSGKLGSIGSWTRYNATYENDTLIEASMSIYYDSDYYKQPCSWCSPLNGHVASPQELHLGGYPTRFVRFPNSEYKFKEVYTNTSYTLDLFSVQVENSPHAYEKYGEFTRGDILGYQVTGNENTSIPNQVTLYGTKFVASATVKVCGIKLRINWAGMTSVLHGKAALYDASLNLINGGADQGITYGSTSQGLNDWSEVMALTDYVQIQQGTSYWIFVRININAETYIYDSDGEANQTIVMIQSPYTADWNETLTSPSYYPKKISMCAVSSVLACFGLGTIPVHYVMPLSWNTPQTLTLLPRLAFNTAPLWATATSWNILTQNGFNIVASLQNTFQWLLDVVHTQFITIDLSWLLSQSWSILTQSAINIIPQLQLLESYNVLTQSVFNLLPQWQTSQTFTVLTQSIFNVLSSLQSTFQLVLDVALAKFYTIGLTWVLSESWSLITLSIFNVIPSWNLTESWTVLTQSIFNLLPLWSLPASWTILTQTTFSLTSGWTTSLGWLIEVIRTIQPHQYFVDLAWSLGASWAMLTTNIYNVLPIWNLNIAWTVLTQTVFNLMPQWNLPQTWTILTQSTFNLVTNLTETFTWILTISTGIFYTVNLSWVTSLSWAIDVVYTLGVGLSTITWALATALIMIACVITYALTTTKKD